MPDNDFLTDLPLAGDLVAEDFSANPPLPIDADSGARNDNPAATARRR
jgi:hypothetical protein